MFKNCATIAIGFLAVVSMTACMGPTKTGIEARKASRQRIGLMNAELAYDRAEQAFTVGRFERALREIDAAIMQYPDAPRFYVLQGRIHLEAHDLEFAVQAFEQALEKDGKNAEAHYYMAIVFQRWSDDEQAFAHYQSAFEFDSNNVQYLLASAESLIALGEFDQSAELLTDRLDYFEHNAAIHHLLGQIAMLQGDPQLAMAEYNEAHLLSPDDLFLLQELARVQYDAAAYEKCYDSIKQLQLRLTFKEKDQGPEFTQSESSLILMEARCLTLLGRNIEARTLYTQLTNENPDDINVWIELGTLSWELEDYHRLAQCAIRSLSLAPDRYEGYMLKGVNERHHGNTYEAVALLRQAADRSPTAAMPHILLGMTLEESGEPDEALESYATAMQIEPNSKEAAALHGRLVRSMQASVPTTNGHPGSTP